MSTRTVHRRPPSGPASSYEPAIVNAFRRITQALRLAAAQTQQQAAISAAQLFVLSHLEQGGPLSISELADATMTDRSSVADVVERLAVRRLVRRRASAADGRRAEIRITAAGSELLRRAPEAPTAQLIAGIKGLSEREQRSLALGLLRLCDQMGLQGTPAGMLFESAPAHGAARRRRPG